AGCPSDATKPPTSTTVTTSARPSDLWRHIAQQARRQRPLCRVGVVIPPGWGARSREDCPVGRISARIDAINESATLAVDAKAKALKAAGENVIGFGAGEPDFPTPEPVVQAAVDACRDPRNHR